MDFLTELDRRRKMETGSSVLDAVATPPERAATAQRVAGALGITPEMVLADPSTEQEARAKQILGILDTAPATRAFMSSPVNAAVSHDQTEQLSSIERDFRRLLRGREFQVKVGGFDVLKALRGTAINNVMLGIAERSVNIAGGLGRAYGANVKWQSDVYESWGLPTQIDISRKGLTYRHRTDEEAARPMLGVSVGAVRAMQEFGGLYEARTTWDEFKEHPVRNFIPFALEQGIVSVPDMAAAIIALPAYVAARVGEIGQTRAENDKRKDATIGDLVAALPVAVASSLLERLGAKGILGLDDVVKGGLRSVPGAVVKAGAKEGLTEAGQEGVESLGETVGTATGFDPLATAERMAAGAVGGLGFGGVTRSVTAPVEVYSQRVAAAAEAKAAAEHLDTIVEAVVANPLTERSPEQMREFLAGAVDGEVHIPAEVVNNFLQARRFDDVEGLAESWGIADQLPEALAAGADVVVDAATYLAKIAPVAHDAFKNDLRLGGGALSLKEATEFEANGDAALDEAAAQVVDQVAADEAAAAPAAQVFQTVYGQALDAGFTPDVARQYAALWGSRYEARAARSPDLYADALAAFNASRVAIRQEIPADLKARIDKIDVLINALRARSRPKAGESLLGPSLLTFVSTAGGIVDQAGELAAMDAGAWHKDKKFRRRLVREAKDKTDAVNHGAERVAERAFDAGYIAEPTEAALLEAMREELAGNLLFPADAKAGVSQAREEFGSALGQLDELLARMGLDIDNATNGQIKTALDAYQADLVASYEQPADGSAFTGPRGRIDLLHDGERVITVFQSRDLSTLLHEGGHLWLEELRQDAAAGSAAAQVELQIIDDWFAKNAIIDAVEQHEAWARATEAYLLEGKAPSASLRAAFARFKSWLISLYRTVKALNTPIDDEIRGVLDRLIATDEEIAIARETTLAEPMFPDAKAAGMTDAEFGAYNKTVQRSREATHDALLSKVMGAVKRRRTAEWKAEAEELRPDAAATIDSAPEMRALGWLRANKAALSREAVVDILGDASAVAMLPKSVPPLVVERGGLHPDNLAEVSGYRTGEEMLRGLMAVEVERQGMKAADDKRSVRTARIDAEVARLQVERHGDPFTDGSIEREALDAVHHERQGEVLAAELRVLGRKTGSKPTPLQIMREWARSNIAAKRMRDATRTDRYLRAERKAANAAIDAAAKGDHAAAVREKQAQLLNHLLYSEARKAADLAEKAIKMLSRYAKARTIKGMDQEYLEQIHGLLERFDFAPTTLKAADRRAAFAAWVQAKRDAGEDVAVSDDLLSGASRTPYVNMTVEELSGLYDAIRSIAHLGRLKQTLLDNREKRDFEAVIDEAVAQSARLKTVRDLSVANPYPKWWAQGDAALLKVETFVDWLDDRDINGVFNRILIRPATDAADREGQLREEISGKIGALREAVPEAQRKAWANAWASPQLLEPRTGEPLKMQRGDLIAMALNVGNESNFDKLARGYDWNGETVMRVLNAELTAEEWTFVQGVWDTLETLWPDIAAVERKLSGVEPERVVPREVETATAGTLRGGYYPAVYDYERSADAAKWAAKEAGDMFGGVFYTAGTPKGHTKTRTAYAAPISLSVNRVLNGHVNKVIKRVAYGEFVMSARKFIIDRRVKQIIQAKLGQEYYDQLMPWLQRQVTDQVSPSKELAFMERFVRKARTNFQMVAMGLRVTTGLAQTAGLTSSAAVVGPEWVAKGIAETARLGVHGAPEFVFSRSPEMEQRGRELDRDMRDAMMDFKDGEGLLDPIRRAAFMHIGFIDRYMVAMPTWLGAYNKAISEGLSEEDAIASSDKAVRTSQGSGRAKDLAAVQAPHNEFMKLFTLFYSYFNVQYQRQRDAGRAFGEGDIARGVSISFWMLLAAPLAAALVTGDLPDEEEGWLKWVGAKVFFNLWSGIPVVRDVTAYAERKVRGKYSEYAVTPLARVAGSTEDLLGDILKLVKDGEPGDRWIKHAIETPGYFVGLPTGQVANTVQYLSDLIDGDQEPENIGEFLTGMMKGPQRDQE